VRAIEGRRGAARARPVTGPARPPVFAGREIACVEVDVTFLIADLAGFTALTEIHGSRYAAGLITRYMEIVRDVLPPGTRLAERVGDAVLLIAPDGPRAVRTAITLREATEREPLFPLLRVGVHGGAVVELAGSYFGTPLNLTARLAAHALPGQILCTESVAAGCALEAVDFRRLGAVTLKNILQPVTLFEVVTAGRHADDPIDPVCRMRVDPAAAAAQLAHGGRAYYFCSPACARIFAAQSAGVA
jgi:adenylate cyclase